MRRSGTADNYNDLMLALRYAYLLALAVHRDGAFVTLDRKVDLGLVRNAEPRHLVTI